MFPLTTRTTTAVSVQDDSLTNSDAGLGVELSRRLLAQVLSESALGDAAHIPFEHCGRVRERHRFSLAGSKRGWYYFATTQPTKWCERRYEMRVAAAARPRHRRRRRRGAALRPGLPRRRRSRLAHARRLRSPPRWLRECRGRSTRTLRGQADFVRQRAAREVACAAAGWSCAVCSEIAAVFEANLDWLASCRHRLVDPLGCWPGGGSSAGACTSRPGCGRATSGRRHGPTGWYRCRSCRGSTCSMAASPLPPRVGDICADGSARSPWVSSP